MLHPNSHPRHVGNRLETTGSKFGESNLRNKDLDALHATGPANGKLVITAPLVRFGGIVSVDC